MLNRVYLYIPYILKVGSKSLLILLIATLITDILTEKTQKYDEKFA